MQHILFAHPPAIAAENEKTIWERLSVLPSQVRSKLKREIAGCMETSENAVQAYICDNLERGKYRKWNELNKQNKLKLNYKHAFMKVTGLSEEEWAKEDTYLFCSMTEGKITYRLELLVEKSSNHSPILTQKQYYDSIK